MSKPIKVFLTHDSISFKTALITRFSQDPFISLVGEASHPAESMGRLPLLRPDVFVCGAGEERSDAGILSALLTKYPIPVVVIGTNAHAKIDLLRAGVYSFLLKPAFLSAAQLERFCEEVIQKIKAAVFSPMARRGNEAASAAAPAMGSGYSFHGIVAIGASTGGTQSTAKILKHLPADFPGTVIVQHMPPDFTRMYAESIDRECQMSIREAKDGDAILPGHVLIAPGAMHMKVSARPGRGYGVTCLRGGKVNGHCPSVDVLFESVALVAGSNAVGVILTGMGEDGARGLTAMRKRGAYTLGQDEPSCVVYGMPRKAHEMGGVTRQGNLEQIAQYLLSYVKTKQK